MSSIGLRNMNVTKRLHYKIHLKSHLILFLPYLQGDGPIISINSYRLVTNNIITYNLYKMAQIQ